MTEPAVRDLQADLRLDEEAARFELEAAERAMIEAEAVVVPELIDADPDAVRARAHAVAAARAAAVVEYRTLGARPDFDAAIEQEVLEVLRALEEATASTAAVRRQSHFVLGLGNLFGVAAIGSAAARVVVFAADPAGPPVAAAMLGGGSFPALAVGVAAARVFWSARRTRKLKPSLGQALRSSGCRTVRELADRRDAVDRWDQRAHIAADAADRLAVAVREWYQVSGVGADPAEVEELLAHTEWYRVARAASDRARVAHRIAAARLARAEILAAGGQPPADAEPTSDRIQLALLRLRRGARLTWRRAS